VGAPAPDREPVRHGIQTRIAILVLLAALAPTAILGGAAIAGLIDMRAHLLAERLALTQGLARRADHFIRDVLESLASVPSEDWSLDLANGGTPQRAALRVVRVKARLANRAFLLDAGGRVVLEEPAGSAEGIDIARDLVEPGLIGQGRPAVVSIGVEGSTGGPLMAIVPLRGASGEICGAAVAVLDPRSDAWEAMLRPFVKSPAAIVCVVDAHGRVLASWPRDASVPAVKSQEALVRLFADRRAEVVVGAEAGRERRVEAVAPLSIVPWSFVLAESEASLLAPIARLRRLSLVAVPVLALLTALFAWGIARSVKKPLEILGAHAERIAAGALEGPVPDLGVDEVGRLGRTFETMRRALSRSLEDLRRANHEMERRVEERTRELRGLYNELRVKDEQRSRLLRKVIGAQEDERKRIARELHDESCQTVAALKMRLDASVHDAPREELRKTLDDVRALAARSLDEMHRLMFALRPPVLDDLGLASAVRWLAQRDLPAKGVRLHMDLDDAAQRVPFDVEIAVFRAIQEALSNVMRHSEAESVWIRVSVADGVLEAEIEDDGVGFDPAEVATPAASGRGLGILGMRERLDLVSGSVEVESSPGTGTRVLMRVPLEKEAPLAR
jgi:signal transduction histidine kinase